MPADRYWYVFGADINVVGADTARFLQIFHRITTGSANFDVAIAAGLQAVANTRIILNRPVLVPPGGSLFGTAVSIGAASNLTMNINYVEHRILDPMPQV